MKNLNELKKKYPNSRCKGVHLVMNCKTNVITIDNFYTSKSTLKPQYEIIASFYTKKEAKKILKTIEADNKAVQIEVTKITFQQETCHDGEGWRYAGEVYFHLSTGEVVSTLVNYEKQKCSKCGVIHPNSVMSGWDPVCEKCK